MPKTKYINYLLNPLHLLRTKKVLHVNPTVTAPSSPETPVSITLFEYDKSSFHSAELPSVEACFPHLDSPSISWINIDGLRKAEIENLCDHFGIHPLITEDILSTNQRPKMDEINGLVFCLLSMLYFNPKNNTVETEQISIVLGKNFVISFQEIADKDVFSSLRGKLKIPTTKVRQGGPDFLFYSLIDAIVDHYFIVMEQLGEHIELLEEQIIRYPNKKSLAKINMIRKEMIVLKRSISPVRELVNGILRSESSLIEDVTEKYFKDIYDHIVQANELAENYRDMMINLQDLYLSNVNLKMNEVMKVMAVVTCLLAPATVIGGIFGMNFEKIPWLHNQYGFFIAVGLMLIIPIWMITMFKRKGWF